VNCVETVFELPSTDLAFSELLATEPESGGTAEMVYRAAGPVVTDFSACYARELSSLSVRMRTARIRTRRVCRLHFERASQG
jgi:hypothetical protein